MNQRQKQTLQREWTHKNAGVETWGAFNGPPEFAMGSHSVVTSFCSMAESSLTRIESTYATAHCSRWIERWRGRNAIMIEKLRHYRQ
ncbi:hypothetical protein ACFW04_010321 [Cataglyphis niger]